jgi:parallel beta-helix repeat protein
MAEQRAFVDYRSGGDTGQNDVLSIQPVSTQEGATEANFRRPMENLRTRTETIRGHLQDLFYFRDFGRVFLELTSGGSVAWGGLVSEGGTGIVTVTGTLKVSPFLSPAAPIRGSLALGVAGTNQVVYSASASSYATQGSNSITVEHRAQTGQALSVSISTGPVKRVLVRFDGANAAHTPAAVKAAVDAAVAADTDLTGKLTLTTSGSGIVAVSSESPLSGSVDDESHWVAGTLITALTTSRKLTAGDGVAIWYKYVVEPTADPTDPKGAVAGGRGESSIARNNHNIPAGSLFVTSDNASKIPGAVALFRVGLHGQLVLADGTRIARGESTNFSSINTTVTTQLTPAISSALATFNSGTVAPERTAAINSALSAYNSSTIGPQRDAAISNALSSYNSSTIGPQRDAAITTALNNYGTNVTSALNTYNTNTIIPQRDAAIAAAMAGTSSGVSQTQVNTTIANYNTATIIPQRDAAINAAIASIPAGVTTPKSVTAVFTASSGGDFNGVSSVNNMVDGTYPNGGLFYVAPGAYTLTTGAAVSATRFVYSAPAAGTTYGYTSLTVNAGLTIPISGEWNGFEFKGAGTFRLDGRVILRNCVIDAASLSVNSNAFLIFENVRINGTKITGSSADGITIPANVNCDFRNCQFSNAITGATVAGGTVHIVGPSNSQPLRRFTNCEITGATVAGAAAPISAIYITDENTSNSRIEFNNCHISHAGTSNLGRTIKIYNSTEITFRGCKIRSFVGGIILDQDIGGATYDDCLFETSDTVNVGSGITAPTSRMIWVHNSTYASVPGLRIDPAYDTGTYFKNCRVRIGEATRQAIAIEPVVDLGNPFTGGDTGRGCAPVFVDGLYITYSNANKVALNTAHFRAYGPGRGGDVVSYIKNVTVDFNGCYRTGSLLGGSSGLVFFYGNSSAASSNFLDLHGENITLANLPGPGANNTLGAAIYGFHAHLRSVTVSYIASTVTAYPILGDVCQFGSCRVEELILRGGEHMYTTSTVVNLSAGSKLHGGALYNLPNTNTQQAAILLAVNSEMLNFNIQASAAFTQTYPIIAVANKSIVGFCRVYCAVYHPGTVIMLSGTGAANCRIIGNIFEGNAQTSVLVETTATSTVQGNQISNSYSPSGASVTGSPITTGNYVKAAFDPWN